MLPYDIPYGALVADGVDGLLMAGRCISGDFLAHSSYRVTGNAVAMGESAGRAAAWCASHGLLPHQLNWPLPEADAGGAGREHQPTAHPVSSAELSTTSKSGRDNPVSGVAPRATGFPV